MRREFTYLGRLIVIEEPDEPRRPEAHAAHECADPTCEEHGDHDDHDGDDDHDDGHDDGHGHHGSVIIIDGREVMVHHLASGYYHAHEFPFMRFSTIEDLAKAFANYLEFGTYHGHSEESE